MKLFHLGKHKTDGSRVHTNIHILYTEYTPSIITDMNYELEVEESTLEFQRVQHHDVIKIGHILGMMDKINLQ